MPPCVTPDHAELASASLPTVTWIMFAQRVITLALLHLAAVSAGGLQSHSTTLDSVPPPSSPPPVYFITDEIDLAQHISAATGPQVLMLPATLLITQPLPLSQSQLQLQAVSSTLISCSSASFTVLMTNSSMFSMVGLTWTGCGTVLQVQNSASGADSSISISDCSFLGNSNGPRAVSRHS